LMSASRVGVMARRYARPVLWVPKNAGEVPVAQGIDDDPF
jgi:hypothetical protein